MDLSFLWGVTILGQSQNSGQLQRLASACKQLLFFSLLCVPLLPFLDHCIFDNSIADT